MSRGSERSCGIDLDGGHNGRDELEEDDEVEVDTHALNLLFRAGTLLVLAVPTRAPEEPLLLLVFGRRPCCVGLALGLLFLDDSRVHPFDHLLHHARMFARVY